MKYIIEKVNTVPGPGDKALVFGTSPKESSEEEFNDLMRNFLDSGSNTEEEKQQLMDTAWEYLRNGKSLTIGENILYLKNY